MQIKVGFLVSYDYQYLENSLPLVYEHADIIVLAIDKNRRTWNGEIFEIKDEFFEWLKTIDSKKKIKIYEDDFYIPSLTTIENDTRERNMLARFMGEGGWHIQIDSDEYFIDFAGFVNFLKRKSRYLANPSKNPVDICAFLVVLYKKTERGFLYVQNISELCVLATNFPQYTAARYSSNCRKFSSFTLLHQTWARSEREMVQKFNNWGHNKDFDTNQIYRSWESVNESNYKSFKNLHPISGPDWKSLGFIEGSSINEIIKRIKDKTFKVSFLVIFYYKLKEIKRQFLIKLRKTRS
jgi:hypothetical protein